MNGNKIQTESPLGYRLRKAVQTREKNHSLILILDYPLKVAVIDPFWKAVISLLDTQKFVPLGEILPLAGRPGPDKIESYLNELVRKGFLETEGVSRLTEYPFVSVIIPVRNRPEEIAACLESLTRLDYPEARMEIIVVDDASDDGTPDAVSAFPVQLISLKDQSQASFCRNLAAQRAKGGILAFLDSDCLADPLWLRELVPVFKDPSTGAVGGLVDSYFHEKGLDRYEKVKSSLNMGLWPKSSREGDPFFYLPSCNLLVRRPAFLGAGGFREELAVGEDVDLCWRLQDEGLHLEYRPVGRIYHKHRNQIRHFCARRFEYGTSEPFLQHAHAGRSKRFLIPPFAALFWGFIFCFLASGRLPFLTFCGIVLLADSLIRSARMRRKNIPIPFPRLALAAFRGYLAVFYSWAAFFSRYYLIWALILFRWIPLACSIVLGLHVLTAIGEYLIKKPALRFPLFFTYFTLDQLSYQWGVWWGCLRRHFFGPVNPRIVGKVKHHGTSIER
ncbi:MAG: mycofactocin biosynthesis glycosyltransferase MftF [Pseudomonadota bacterium]